MTLPKIDLRASLFLLMLIATTLPIVAQNFWQHTSAPLGGTVNFLAESDNGSIIAGTEEGIFISSDNGSTWNRIGGVMINNHYTDIFKTAAGVIYVVGSNRTSETVHLFRTGDNGITWEEIPNVPANAFTAPNPRLPQVVVNAQGDIFVSGSQSGPGNTSHLVRSTDDGSTWTPVMSSAIIGGSLFISDLAINSSGDIFVAAPSGQDGVFRSTDNGDNWNMVYNNNTINVAVAGNGDVYIISGNGHDEVRRSTDNGSTWLDVSAGLPSGISNLNGLTVDAAGVVFAGMALRIQDGAVGGNGIVRSADNGATWNLLQSGLPQSRNFILNFAGVHAILNHSSGQLFTGLNANSVELSTNDGVGGVYVSSDNGSNWVEANTGIEAVSFNIVEAHGTGAVFATPHYGILHSNDGGATWEDRSPELVSGASFVVHSLAEDAQSGDLLAGGSNLLYRSSDMGVNWTEISNNQLNGTIRAVATNSTGNIFVAQTGGFSRSTDGGANWQLVLSGGGSLNLHIAPNDIIYAVKAQGGLWRSTDNGDNWTFLNNGITSLVKHVNSAPDNTVYAADQWIWRSTDNGDSWTRIDTNGIPQGSNGFFWPEVSSLATNSLGHVFASVKYTDVMDVPHFGVFRSTDQGNSWDLYTDGLIGPYTEVSDISIDPGGVAYLAASNGVYQSRGSTTGIGENKPGLPTGFSLEQNYPNPFNPKTTIRFRLPSATKVTASVYNPLGQKVTELLNRSLAAGEHQIAWQPFALSGGIYILDFQAGEHRLQIKMLYLR